MSNANQHDARHASRAMVRVFVALPLPNSARAALRDFTASLPEIDGPPFAWVPPVNMHLTLRFLGDIPANQVGAVAAAGRAAIGAGRPPLKLVVRGTGAFPSLQRPQVLWAGVSGDVAALRHLAQRVESRLVQVGFPPVDKPFAAHITLARCRQQVASAAAAAGRWQQAGERLVVPFAATEMVVFRSTLSPQGAVYAPLSTVPFNPPGPGEGKKESTWQ